MFKRRSVVPTLLLLGALVGCQPAAPPAPAALSDKDVSDIKAVTDRWVNDFLTNKRDDLANILTADMILLPPNMGPQVGRDASMAYLKSYPTITKFTVTKDEVTGVGDLAYLRGTYSIDVTMPDKSTAHENGTAIEIHRKQADGSWPYSRLIWHSSEPLPTAAPAPKK